jgi:hypothetical protein
MCHIVIRDKDKDDDERKERVIHTRVPESLEAELRQRAQDLGISVSNLVRNVLGHAFGLVGDVVADGHAIARAARGAATSASAAATAVRAAEVPRAPAAPSFDDVLGWQRVTLAKNAVCARCNAIMPRGSDAAFGIAAVADPAAPPLVICIACFAEVGA